jgi:hypothetical protein
VQPPVQISTLYISGVPLAMSSRPVPAKPQEEEKGSGEEKDSYLDEEGDKMIEEENEQNFDFW